MKMVRELRDRKPLDAAEVLLAETQEK
jgi:hypothetical protein